MTSKNILQDQLRVINIGLEVFAGHTNLIQPDSETCLARRDQHSQITYSRFASAVTFELSRH